MTPEAKLKTALQKGFHDYFGRGDGVMTGAIGVALGQKRGLPDRYFGIPGHFAWIEAKVGAGKGELKDAGQIRQCRDLASCGQRVFVLWCENIETPASYRRISLTPIGIQTPYRLFWADMQAPSFWSIVFGVPFK